MERFDENEQSSLKYVYKVFIQDRKNGFQRISQDAFHSVSPVLVCSHLSERLDLIQHTDLTVPIIQRENMQGFTLTIQNILQCYADLVKNEYSSSILDTRIVCTLMNNVQQLRIKFTEITEQNGKSEDKWTDNFIELGDLLKKVLNDLTFQFCQSLEEQISSSVDEVVEQLCASNKHTCTSNKLDEITQGNFIYAKADEVISPLMNFLDVNLSMYAQHCEKKVLLKLLKGIWKLVFCKLHEGLFPQGNEERKPGRNISRRKYEIIEVFMEILLEYFYAGGNGVKEQTLKSTLEFQSLSIAVSVMTKESTLTSDESSKVESGSRVKS